MLGEVTPGRPEPATYQKKGSDGPGQGSCGTDQTSPTANSAELYAAMNLAWHNWHLEPVIPSRAENSETQIGSPQSKHVST